MLTPWGPSESLRTRRLPPGPGTPRADVERNHRERLYGAMVAVVDEGGYEGVRVGKVAERAGVSRSALYSYFSDRQECFLATFDALLDEGIATVERAYEEGDDVPAEERLRRALQALVDLLAAQPAAARLCFLEAYSAGPPAAAIRKRAADSLEALLLKTIADCPERVAVPREIVSGVVGGIRILIQTRLRRRREQELRKIVPKVLEWLTSYSAPAATLPAGRVEPTPRLGFRPTNHRERLFVALTTAIDAKGYVETSVSDIAAAASMSLSTFYDTFDGKEDAFLAACDFGVEQGFAAAHNAYEREAEWPSKVAAGVCALFDFLASEPEWAYMAMVEILAAGPRARARRDRTLELFGALMMSEFHRPDRPDPIVIEAVIDASYSLMYAQIAERGAERLPEIVPVALFTLLTPLIGADEAAAVASGNPMATR